MSKILNSVTLLNICTRGKRQLIPWRKSLCCLGLMLAFFLSRSQTGFLASSTISSKVRVAITSITNNVNPSVTVVDGSGNDLPGATICPGSSITLYANATGDQPISFLWTSVPAGFTSTDQNITVNPSATTTYTITVTDANGLTASDIVTVIVNPLPTVDQINNLNYCNGDAVSAINFTGPVSGTSFTWTNSNASVGLATSGPGNIPSFTATNLTTSPVSAAITVTQQPMDVQEHPQHL